MTADGSTRRLSPAGDSRERPVPCRCCRRMTIAIDAVCDRCHERNPDSRHTPFTDDGVTYCGWDGIDGCGEVWPCSTVRAGADQ